MSIGVNVLESLSTSTHFALLDAAQRRGGIGCETITQEHLRRSAEVIAGLWSNAGGG